jgi:ABC-type spermidine/putrescine transport system permease subunit II
MAGLDPAIHASRRQGAPQFQIVETISKPYVQGAICAGLFAAALS